MGQQSGSTPGVQDSALALGRELDQRSVRAVYLPRYLAVAAFALAAAFVGNLPWWTPIAVLVGGLGSIVVAHIYTDRNGRVPAYLHINDVLVCLIFPPVADAAIVPAVLAMLSAVAIAATLTGAEIAFFVTLIGVTGLALEHAFFGLTEGPLIIVSFAIASVVVTTVVGQLTALEAAVRSRLDTVVDNLNAALWVREAGGHRVTFVNQRASTILGWSEEEWFTPGFWQRNIHPQDLDRVIGVVERSIALGIDYEVRYRFFSADGRWVHLHDRAGAVVDANGNTISLQGMSLDVTDRVQIEQRVSRYADIVDGIDLALIVLQIDPDSDQPVRLSAANPASARLLERDLSLLVGSSVGDVFPTLSGSRLESRLMKVAHRSSPLRVDNMVVQPVGGRRRVVTLRAFPLPENSVGVSLQDVTDAVAASEALRREALYDGLTGLPNRRLLDDELHKAISRAPSSGERVALLMMDLDQFKEVNDALGHHVGDQLLRGIGDRLATLIDDALIARLGGDEFAVVIAGMIEIDTAVEMANRIRDALAEPFLIDAVRLQSNASIGIAMFPDQATDVATLVQRADVAMYVAKRSGTGVSVYAADQDRSSIERITLIGDLAGAVAAGEFELHFQPFIDLRTGRPIRVEALVRWHHPELGLLQPAQFIELAELSGAIQPLTNWVVEEGLRAATKWRAAGHEVGLAVNLSVRNLYDPTLVPHLADQLEITGVPPSCLVLELTETELMDDPGLAREVFSAVGALGVNTSIDDFGTGYSSLTYLRDLPLQEIKIDRSFVSEMLRRSDEFTIVRSMIDLGHNLGLDVVAEGVEQLEDLQLLVRLGCDLAQGFHISRPLPLDRLLVWLDEYPGAGPGVRKQRQDVIDSA